MNATSTTLTVTDIPLYSEALARAVYARCSIVLLDDVFSGMDRHTVEHVSSSLLGSHGILRNHKATVVIATHSRTYHSPWGFPLQSN